MPWSIFTDGGGPEVAVGWAKQLLASTGAPDTPGNEEFIYQWEKAEGGGGKFNPLNQGPDPGKPSLTTTGSQFGGGAADYASWQAGIQGATDYLHMPAYRGVLAGLQANNPSAARSALWASPWAASHYGFGANWPNVGLPGGTPILPTPGVNQAGLPSTPGIPGLPNPIAPSTWIKAIADIFGVPDLKDLAERLGMILLGAILLLIGVYLNSRQSGHHAVNVLVGGEKKIREAESSVRSIKKPTVGKARTKTNAGKAISNAADA